MMKVILRAIKILFFTIFMVVGMILLSTRRLWKTIKWQYRAVIVVGLVMFLLFETITPVYWLALTQYYEARDEALLGRYAVANVVLNRTEDNRWPNTVKGVVSDGRERGNKCDFSFMCDGKLEQPWKSSHKIDWVIIKSESWIVMTLDLVGLRYDPTGDSVYYKRSDVNSPWFNKQLRKGRMEQVTGNFGAHEFFR